MIYILAPYSIKLNTTSRNRIISFYKALKEQNIDTAIISPSLLVSLNTWYNQEGEDYSDLNVIFLPDIKLNMIKLAATRQRRQLKVIYFILKSLVSPFLTYSNPLTLKKSGLDSISFSSKDTIICSYPSPTSITIANTITNKYGCQLVLDYRDPWTFGYHSVDLPKFASHIRKKLERAFENSLLRRAKAITVISANLKRALPQELQFKTFVVRNGANSHYIDPDKIQPHSDKLRIVYLGTIYNQQLKDTVFFEALINFIKVNAIQREDFELIFIGPNNSKIFEVIKKNDLELYTRVVPTLNIQQALQIGYTASAFLHLRYGKANEIYTSKHADYLALQKPILLPVSDKGVLAANILENNAGYVCRNEEECYNALLELWQKYQRGESFKIPRSKEYLYNISREAEAEKLVEIIKKIQ